MKRKVRSKYVITTTVVSVHLASESPIYGESAVHVTLQDDAAGIFLLITNDSSEGDKRPGEVRLDVEQFDALVEAVELLTGPLDVETGLRSPG